MKFSASFPITLLLHFIKIIALTRKLQRLRPTLNTNVDFIDATDAISFTSTDQCRIQEHGDGGRCGCIPVCQKMFVTFAHI